MAEIKKCLCGGTPKFIKLYDRLRYEGFISCPKCGYEGRLYASKQGAVKAWNKNIEKSRTTGVDEQ